MTGWFAKSLGDPLTAGEPLSRIEERFRAEYAKAGGPGDMALFTRLESEGRLHCEVRVYLSPASTAVARAEAKSIAQMPGRVDRRRRSWWGP